MDSVGAVGRHRTVQLFFFCRSEQRWHSVTLLARTDEVIE